MDNVAKLKQKPSAGRAAAVPVPTEFCRALHLPANHRHVRIASNAAMIYFAARGKIAVTHAPLQLREF